MRKAIMIMFAVIVTGQADAKENKTTMGTIKFTKHYDKSSPVLSKQNGSTPKPTTSGSSQMKGRH
jgi:type VI protein secretion system component Hcp